MSFEYADALSTVVVTAYYGLIDAGAGGMGQSCIQIAQAVGAWVYANVNVSSREERKLLKSRYGIFDDVWSENCGFSAYGGEGSRDCSKYSC